MSNTNLFENLLHNDAAQKQLQQKVFAYNHGKGVRWMDLARCVAEQRNSVVMTGVRHS